MNGHLVTWLLSVIASAILGGAWIYTHPYPRMVSVNVTKLIDEKRSTLENSVKQGQSEEEQKALVQEAAAYGARLEAALDQIARECNCAVINAAAIVKTPPNWRAIPDLTDRVREMTK